MIFGRWVHRCFVLVFACLGFFTYTSGVHAAYVYLTPDTADVYRGDTVTIDVRIDTDEDECINVVRGVIEYPSVVRAEDVAVGKSILVTWVEPPKIDETNHVITFAGGIPGGYCGRVSGDPSLTNILAQIIFRSPGLAIGVKDMPVATIQVASSSEVFMNDGLGTLTTARFGSATLNLMPNAGSVNSDSWNDQVSDDVYPPADFGITLSKDETAFGGRYFISFSTQDKQSGIDHYEIMEEPLEDLYAFKWGRVDAPWVQKESPYVLEDQTLNSTIRVKAVDKAGNTTIAVLVPDSALRTISDARLMTIMVIGSITAVVISIIAFILIRRRNRIIATYDENTIQ